MAGVIGTFRTYTTFTLYFLKTRFVYRASFWINLGFSFLFLLMQVYLWKLCSGAGTFTDTTASEMITYVVLAGVIRNFVGSGAAYVSKTVCSAATLSLISSGPNSVCR